MLLSVLKLLRARIETRSTLDTQSNLALLLRTIMAPIWFSSLFLPYYYTASVIQWTNLGLGYLMLVVMLSVPSLSMTEVL